MNNSYQEYLNFSHKLADAASETSMQYFRTSLDIDNKSDDSPVTIADKNTELKIRSLVEKEYPNHGILGEEFDSSNPDADFVWVIDPIDGTRSYIAGHKDFGNLISLTHNKKPIIGIINCPAHNERWVGVINQQSTYNHEPANTSEVENIEDAYLFTSGLYFEEPQLRNAVDKINKKVRYYRYGGDCYMYGMLTSGLIDIVIEDTLKAHDYMALVNVIEGAGGQISDKFGNAISTDSQGSVVASANKELHSKLISIINE
ncbi:MAG: histidinol phosphate phosphatase [Pelagibacteraceae bacterium]|nr:histidinol phosphate phosphatase [Pelagibacteraceae bacterium]